MIKKSDYIELIDIFFENNTASKTKIKEWSDAYLSEQYDEILDKIYQKITFGDNAKSSDENKLKKITDIEKKIQFDKYYDLIFFYSNIKNIGLSVDSSNKKAIDEKFKKLKKAKYNSTGFSEESIKKLLSKEEKNLQEPLKNKDGRKYRFIITVVIPMVLGKNNALIKELHERRNELLLDSNIYQFESIMNRCNNNQHCISEIKLHEFACVHFKFYTGLLRNRSINDAEIIDNAIKCTYKMVNCYQDSSDSLSDDAIYEIFTFVMMNDLEIQNTSKKFFKKGE